MIRQIFIAPRGIKNSLFPDWFKILDIITFWLNLKEANAKGVAEWKELYSFKDAYGLKNFKAESLGQLAQKLEPGADNL